MDHHHQPVDIDPHNLQHARDLWHNFIQMAKYGVIAVVILLILMYIFLV